MHEEMSEQDKPRCEWGSTDLSFGQSPYIDIEKQSYVVIQEGKYGAPKREYWHLDCWEAMRAP